MLSTFLTGAGKCLGRHPIREVVWFALLGGGYWPAQQGRCLRDWQPCHEWAPLCPGQQRGLHWKSSAAGHEWGPFCAPTRLLLALASTTDTRPPVECLVHSPRALWSVNDPPVSCLATEATRHCIITTETNEPFSGKPCQEFHSIPQTYVHELPALNVSVYCKASSMFRVWTACKECLVLTWIYLRMCHMKQQW